MTDPEITVHITDVEFTIAELQEFLDTARSVDGIPNDGLVTVTKNIENPITYTLRASTEFRSK